MSDIRYMICLQRSDGSWVDGFEEEDSTLSNAMTDIVGQLISGSIITVSIDRIVFEDV